MGGGRPPVNKGTGISPYLNNLPSLDELSESSVVVANLFFGCQLNTRFLLPTLCNGRERSAAEDAEEEEEEEEEEEPEDLILLGCGTGAKSEVAHKWPRWLHNPCRLGVTHRFRAGGEIGRGPQVNKVAT